MDMHKLLVYIYEFLIEQAPVEVFVNQRLHIRKITTDNRNRMCSIYIGDLIITPEYKVQIWQNGFQFSVKETFRKIGISEQQTQIFEEQFQLITGNKAW